MRETHIPVMYSVEDWQNFKLKETFAVFILYFCLLVKSGGKIQNILNEIHRTKAIITSFTKNQSECESEEMCCSKKKKKERKKKETLFPLAKMQIVLLIIMSPLSSSRNSFRNLNFPVISWEDYWPKCFGWLCYTNSST